MIVTISSPTTSIIGNTQVHIDAMQNQLIFSFESILQICMFVMGTIPPQEIETLDLLYPQLKSTYMFAFECPLPI